MTLVRPCDPSAVARRGRLGEGVGSYDGGEVSSAIGDRRRSDYRTRRGRSAGRRKLEWVHYANQVLVEHGAVSGSEAYPARHQAHYRYQRLIELMGQLDLHDRRCLREHTSPAPGRGWTWSVEYVTR